MKHIYISISCGMVILLLTGCMIPIPIPGYVDTSPAVHGRVINKTTKKPIEGVAIQFKDLENKLRTKTLTKQDGTFALGPEEHFYLIKVVTPCPIYYIPAPEPYAWFLEISKLEHLSKSIDLKAIYTKRKDNTFDLGDIEFIPKDTDLKTEDK